MYDKAKNILLWQQFVTAWALWPSLNNVHFLETKQKRFVYDDIKSYTAYLGNSS